MINKFKCFFVVLMATYVAISMATMYANASIKKSGKVDNEIAWVYNSKTKTLTFRPFKSSENPIKIKKHTSDLEYWLENSKKHIYKSGVSRVLRCDALTGSYPHGDYGDAFSKLRKVSLSKSAKVIPTYAYARCHNLKSVLMPYVEYIGSDSLSGAPFKVNKNKKVIFPKNIKRIDYRGLSLTSKRYRNSSLKLNEGLEYIGEYAFDGCELREIVIPNTVKTIEGSAFDSCCGLKKVTLSNNIDRIESGLFSCCTKLDRIVLPDSIVRIDNAAFYNTGIKEITIPANVQTLGVYKYGGWCDYVGIFEECKKLKKISFTGKELKKVYYGAMKGISKNVIIEVPYGMKEKYKNMFVDAGLSTENSVVEKSFKNPKPYYKLSKNNISVKEGFSRRLYVQYLNGDEHISITSGNDSIVQVSEVNSSGEAAICGLNVGETVVKISVDDYELFCEVKVEPDEFDNDEEELRNLIRKQRMYGATVSTNIYDSSQYVWKGGRLTGIYWNNKSVYGDIDLNHFSFLEEFVCHGNSEEFGVNRSTGNYIFSIDANDCSNLKVIVCDGGFLRELYAENADNLQQVELDSTPVQVLDLSSAANLYNLELPDDTMIKILRVSSDVDKETVAKWNIKYISDSIERVK